MYNENVHIDNSYLIRVLFLLALSPTCVLACRELLYWYVCYCCANECVLSRFIYSHSAVIFEFLQRGDGWGCMWHLEGEGVYHVDGWVGGSWFFGICLGYVCRRAH